MGAEELFQYLKSQDISTWSDYFYEGGELKVEEAKKEDKSVHYETADKKLLIERIRQLKDRVNQLERNADEHLDQVAELRKIRDSLCEKLKDADDERRKIYVTLRSQTPEGIIEALNDVYTDRDTKLTIREAIKNFMNYGTVELLDKIPNNFYLQHAVLKARYMKVAKGLPTQVLT